MSYGEPKYIPSPKERQEYPPPKTDVSSLSVAELNRMKTRLGHPLIFDEKVLESIRTGRLNDRD